MTITTNQVDESCQQLNDALTVAKHFIEQYDGDDADTQIWSMFESVVGLSTSETSSYLLEAGKPEEITFSKNEVIKEMQVDREPRLDSLYTKLKERLKEVRPLLIQRANEIGKTVYPTIDKRTGGGKGNKTVYYLKAVSFDEKLIVKETSKSITADGIVHYELESEIPTLPLLARWIYLLINHKWVVLLLGVSPFVMIFLFGASIFLANMGWVTITSNWVLIALGYITVYWLSFRCFTVAIHYNVSMFPALLLPLRLPSAVLEVELNPPMSKLPTKKDVKLRVYRGTCPICGHRIDLEKRHFYSEEIIG